ncbi:MAG: hypothetical protein LBS11_01325 [Oscillospiraceae bacterium]|jgi:hypothetical protein|nr:hypothetical protein [Oscillospiraceae bacterium]
MRYLRRFLWFITVRLFGICVVGAILVVAFYMSMNTTNIIVLSKDGMAARARVILGTEEDPGILSKFFTVECLTRDARVGVALAGESPYEDYDIRGMDHRLNIEWMWTWPWDNTASATAVETMPLIDGRVKSARREAVVETRGEGAVNPPAWNPVRYRITLTRDEGRWIITALNTAEDQPYAE